ncbi:MAG TPA: hypothetical protein VKU00_30200 [Chthonomonadaceae bacterium]|nr:hypothetical protein [Chthonomonadaceae bacterium]
MAQCGKSGGLAPIRKKPAGAFVVGIEILSVSRSSVNRRLLFL